MPNDTDDYQEFVPDGEIVERIDRSTLTPLFDTDHDHVYVDDHSDETDYYIAQMCSVNGCGMGRLMPK